MISPKNVLPKFASLVAMGACLLSSHQASAASEISAGFQFGGAISGGKLRTWGLNDQGQLGQGSGAPNPNPLPTEISDTVNYVAVEAGPDFMFGLTQNGDIKAWGNNSSGQLGVGNTVNRNTPTTVNVQGVKFSDVSAGLTHTLAISTTQELYAWGDNSSGQLGYSDVNGIGYYSDPIPESGNDTAVERPLKIVNYQDGAVNTWLDVAGGQSFSVGIKTDGTLWVWGGAASSLGLTGNFTVPNQIASNITDWVEVEAGAAFVIARRSNGQIYTWGSNAVGQLGLGKSINSRTTPTRVGSKSDWIAIGAGDYSAFAIDSTNTLYAWGYNLSEELGQLVFINDKFQLVNGFIYTPTILSPNNTFTRVDGGRANALGSLNQNEGFTLTKGIVGEEGFYTLGGNMNGQLGLGSISFESVNTPQRAAADGLEISISAPSVNAIDVGVNTSINIDVTVSNNGAVDINVPYLVEIFLSTDSVISEGETPAVTRLTETPLAVNSSNQITFDQVPIGEQNSGEFFLISRVTFDGAPTIGSADIIGVTPISIIRPSFSLSNPIFPTTKIDLGESFTGVDITLSNSTIGVVPENEAIVLEVFLLEDLEFNPVTDEIPSSAVLLSQINYTGGLNSVSAPTSATPPPTSYTFEDLTLTPPVNLSGREDFLILFAINRNGAIGEETGQTESNFRTQRVVISSPNPVAPAINFGNVIGVGGLGEWLPTFDSLALNNNTLRSPTLAAGSASFELDVVGPTTITAPWNLNGDINDEVKYELFDALGNPIEAIGGGAFSERLVGFNPTYQSKFIVIDVDSPLYNETALSAPYPWTIVWTFTQGGTSTGAVARVDLEIPSFIPDPDTFGFFGVTDASAPTLDSQVASTLNSMAQDDVAVLKFNYNFTNSALVKFWWRTDGVAGEDTFSFSVDGLVRSLPTDTFTATANSAIITGNTGWSQVAFIVPAGPHTLRWEFKKGSADPRAAAYIDGLEVLEPLPANNQFNWSNPDPELLPSFLNVGGGQGNWNVITNPDAPNSTSVAISSIGAGSSKSFTYTTAFAGPTVIYAPWQLIGNSTDSIFYKIKDSNNNYIQAAGGGDFQVTQTGTASVFVDRNIVLDANSPLYQASEAANPYPWTIEWTFAQSGPNPASAQVAPTPYNFQFIPVSNVDMQISSVTATPATYILDDANGTGRLPITVSMKNVGAAFVANPSWDPTNLQIRLSLDQTFGNSDDIDLGSYAQVQILPTNDGLVFQADINLPFNTPEGNYFVLLRFDSSFDVGEFTLANNSRVVGPNFIIVRAPNLVIENTQSFSSNYPWRPEQSSYLRYDIANTGLGDVTTNQPFNVQVALHGKLRTTDEFDYVQDLIKTYSPVPHQLFLPQASAQFPNGSSQLITHFIELPPARDILVALNLVPVGTPEDDASVYAKLPELSKYEFYFTITVDSNNAILESSETNTYFAGKVFDIIPTDIIQRDLDDDVVLLPTENFGFYVGHFPFTRFTLRANNPLTIPFDPDPSNPPFIGDSDLDGYSNWMEYAFATDPTSANSPLYDPTRQNGVVQLNVPPDGDSDFLSVTFDFNVRMTDSRLVVQASSDQLNGPWDDIITITPPYLDSVGPKSLTGWGGLISDPRVVSLVGNVTDVQNVYSARITVRDVVPYTSANLNSRFMRVVLQSTSDSPPLEPTNLDAGVEPISRGIVISWNGVAFEPPSAPGLNDGIDAAFHIERSTQSNADYELIGITNVSDPDNNDAAKFLDNDVVANVPYFYRVRTVGTAGVTPYALNPATGQRFVGIILQAN